MLSFKPTFHCPLHFRQEAFWFLFTFCRKGGVICIPEFIDISPGNLDSSLEINGETVETVSDFILGGSRITADSECNHEIKRRLLLGKL